MIYQRTRPLNPTRAVLTVTTQRTCTGLTAQLLGSAFTYQCQLKEQRQRANGLYKSLGALALAAIMSLPLTALWSTTALAQTQRLNDSAQITCYNDSAGTGTVSTSTPDPEAAGFNEQDCTLGLAAADALGQMVKIGGSTAPGRDYTKIANDGSVLPASASLGSGPGDWACTRDNITGLIWEVKVNNAAHLRHLGHRYTWYNTSTAVNGGNAGTLGTNATCNGTLSNCNTTAYRNAINALVGPARLCGASDWRLPTSHELSGLVHAGLSVGPLIDATWFPNTAAPGYWSGENNAGDATRAWNLNILAGVVSAFPKEFNEGLLVRLVRGGQ